MPETRTRDVEHVDVDIVVEAVTFKAVMVENLEGSKVWLPRSQIRGEDDPELGDSLEEGQSVVARIPRWLAEAEGLV